MGGKQRRRERRESRESEERSRTSYVPGCEKSPCGQIHRHRPHRRDHYIPECRRGGCHEEYRGVRECGRGWDCEWGPCAVRGCGTCVQFWGIETCNNYWGVGGCGVNTCGVNVCNQPIVVTRACGNLWYNGYSNPAIGELTVPLGVGCCNNNLCGYGGYGYGYNNVGYQGVVGNVGCRGGCVI